MNLQATPAKPAGSRERSLDEVKAEFMRHAGRLNPFEDIRREDGARMNIPKREHQIIFVH